MERKNNFLSILAIWVVAFFFGGIVVHYLPSIKAINISKINLWDNTLASEWNDGFSLIKIRSSADGSLQRAYFFSTSLKTLKPLIVSLHTWSGDYSQNDPLAAMAKQAGWNYIHPDFRGPNWTVDACLSNKALTDIDDAIQYAKDNGSVDTKNIFVVGVSGGGYAVLGSYLKSVHNIKAFLAWAPISDLSAWFHQSRNRNDKYARHILQCTSDGIVFDQYKAIDRSPLFWNIPNKNLQGRLEIYAGIDDGYTGSVPISHSILFFNRLVSHYGYADKEVGEGDIVELLTHGYEKRGLLRKIDDREVIYEKDSGLVSLVIFEGSHEMLPEFCFKRMKEIAEQNITH